MHDFIISAAGLAAMQGKLRQGKTAAVDADEFAILPFEVKPIDGYQTRENFPNCCDFHRQVQNETERLDREFPTCCEPHKMLLTADWFNLNEFADGGQRARKALAYTEFVIENRRTTLDWYEDITDYLEYCLHSFGALPKKYGGAPGAGAYFSFIYHYIKDSNSLGKEKVDRLLKYLDSYSAPKERSEIPDLNQLIDTYTRWLKEFPYTISFFQHLKEKLTKVPPPILSENPVRNRYLNTVKAKLLSVKELCDFLTDMTKDLLGAINASEIVSKQTTAETMRDTFALLNEELKINTAITLKRYSQQEMPYATMLRDWLRCHKEYFRDIAKLMIVEPDQVQKNHTVFVEALVTYGFYNLPKVKQLPKANIPQLVELMMANELPYKLAMLDFLGFIDHLKDNHFTSAYKVHKELAKWFNSTKDGRTIKGNLNTLLKGTKENKSRYTAHLHKEQVKKDYSKLK